MRRMKNRCGMILVMMIVIGALSFASAEDGTEVFSVPVEEIVLECEDVELPKDDKASFDEFGVEQDQVESEAVDYADYMSNHRFANGDQIFVNLTWREGGDAIAYDNGTYGYVQAKYIAW